MAKIDDPFIVTDEAYPFLHRVVEAPDEIQMTHVRSILDVPLVAKGSTGPALSVDWDDGPQQSAVLTDNAAISFASPPSPCRGMFLYLIQDGTGTRIPTWGSNIHFAGGIAPVLSVAANATDVLEFVFDGTNFHGSAFALASAST